MIIVTIHFLCFVLGIQELDFLFLHANDHERPMRPTIAMQGDKHLCCAFWLFVYWINWSKIQYNFCTNNNNNNLYLLCRENIWKSAILFVQGPALYPLVVDLFDRLLYFMWWWECRGVNAKGNFVVFFNEHGIEERRHENTLIHLAVGWDIL